jgi:hypothetical protein
MSDTVKFIQSIATDNYVEADQLFKKVVKNSLQNIINKKKEEVASQYSKKTEELAKQSLIKKE